jgi:hypothetical protein
MCHKKFFEGLSNQIHLRDRQQKNKQELWDVNFPLGWKTQMGLLFIEISEELGTSFFKIELEGKTGDTPILRNFGKLCEITLFLYPEDSVLVAF